MLSVLKSTDGFPRLTSLFQLYQKTFELILILKKLSRSLCCTDTQTLWNSVLKADRTQVPDLYLSDHNMFISNLVFRCYPLLHTSLFMVFSLLSSSSIRLASIKSAYLSVDRTWSLLKKHSNRDQQQGQIR